MAYANFAKKRLKVFGTELLILMFLILNAKFIDADIIINEIMYDPSGSDDGHEWIEIYNNGASSADLSGWKFFEDNVNHALTLINGSFVLEPDRYALIVDDPNKFISDYPGFIGTILDSSWSSLSNSGEYIAIKDSSLNIIDSINYSTNLAKNNGKSLERFDYGWNESNKVGGSPGKKNNATIPEQSQTKGLKLTIYLEEPVYINTEYTSLFKIENLDHISGATDHINLTISYNITKNNILIKQETLFITDLNSYKTSSTGSFTPASQGNYTVSGWIINSTSNDQNKEDDKDSKTIAVIDTSNEPCNISLNITSDKFIYDEEESIRFINSLNTEIYPFVIEYWIEDFFGNIYKNKYNTTNTNEKSWKTEIQEQDRILFIKSKVYPLCNDSNLTDNYAEKMFIVKSNATDLQGTPNQNKKSSLEITDADETASFGGIINVKVEAYRGDTGKYSISLYAEDNGKKASEITKFNINNKYSSYKGQIPIQLKPNCNLNLENGKYDLILEGLGESDKKSIKIEGIKKDLCGSNMNSMISVSSDKSEKFEYGILEYPEKLQTGAEFETKVQLVNNDEKDYDIDVWSYVYRGSKCYSGERTANKKHLTLEKGASEVVSLQTKIDSAEAGDYNLKVLINKDSQKTNKEITQDIEIIKGDEADSKESGSAESINKPEKPLNIHDYNIINQLLCTDLIHYKQTVYQSSNEKIKSLIPYFIIAVLALISIILLWKRA
jgi:hypothetical protein